MWKTAAGVWLGLVAFLIVTPLVVLVVIVDGPTWPLIYLGGAAAVGMIVAGIWIIVRDWPRA